MTETKKKTTAKKTAKTSKQTPAKKTAEKQAPSLIADNEKVSITLKWAEVDKAYRQALTNFAKDVKTEGFRKGKAPLDVVEKKIGMEKLVDATLQSILPKAYMEAVEKAEKKPITTPEFNPVALDKGKDWVIDAYFAPFPEIKLGDYKKLVTKAKKEALTFIKKQNEELKKAADKAKKDAEAGKAHDHEHNEKLDEGQEREINLQTIFKELVSNIKPKIAELLLRQETQKEFERLKQQLTQYQIKVEDYIKNRGISMEQLSTELASTVLNRLQLDFILAEISKAEKLDVTDEEVKKELAQIQDEKLRQQIEASPEYLDQIKANLLQRKSLEFLLKL
jgi:trigger factor